jgi:sec-independent protein translocase protein TatA
MIIKLWLGEKIMPSLGGWEWIIILVIVLLVFGIGRIGKLGDELGKGVRAFREGVRDVSKDETAEGEEKEEK